MNSRLYECRVMHHRLAPKVHRFRYGIFMLALDLDEIDQVAALIPFFSHNSANLYSFRDSDHLTLPGLETAGVKANVTAWLASQGVDFPGGGRIVLITLPRMLGYVFNPVSFYYCYDAQGEPFCAIAEVGNTFGEMKPYLVSDKEGADVFRRVTPKNFYVSPFMGLDLTFEFRLRAPGDRLDIHVDDRDGSDRMLVTSLTGKAAPLSSRTLAWLTLKYPMVTVKVISLIHAHAVALWLKRVPWHRKADNAGLQIDVLKPHVSLAGKVK